MARGSRLFAILNADEDDDLCKGCEAVKAGIDRWEIWLLWIRLVEDGEKAVIMLVLVARNMTILAYFFEMTIITFWSLLRCLFVRVASMLFACVICFYQGLLNMDAIPRNNTVTPALQVFSFSFFELAQSWSHPEKGHVA